MTNKVMLVEDDATMCSLLSTLLTFEGYQVADLNNADNINQLLMAVRLEKPDLLLIDVNLGMLNGLDILRQVRKDKALLNTRVIMSSGLELSTRCSQEGADGFIQKPYMPDDLLAIIKHTIGN